MTAGQRVTDAALAQLRAVLEEYQPSRERSLAETKLDECAMWLERAGIREAAEAARMAAAYGQVNVESVTPRRVVDAPQA